MIIRASRENDYDTLYRITLASLDEMFQPEIFHYFQMQWPLGQFTACTFDDRPIGYLSSIRDGDAAKIMMFAVDPALRSKGIGRMLLNAFRQRALMDGVRTISLEVRPTNTRAISFYIRQGFSKAGTIDNFYNNGGSAITMMSSVQLNI